ncbi:MAG: bifunctional diaminohydroxyphosphoribosylaminopyrimidine deaminase/5-amino-6-(5-phosphoribosylamino)uracil reductase RibD [Psychrobium sp.]
MSQSASVADIGYMQRAINLAKKGRFTTTPNPNVGCVLVKNEVIVGEGYHQKAGEGHAEVNALAQAGENAQGATAYVTLEPCSHYGRTPPCAVALVSAGVKRVVVAMVDPNPKVAGRGIAILNEAGIETLSGVLEQQARALNPGFLSRMERKRPFVTIKMASTLDGGTALRDGTSKWITSSDARIDVQKFRAQSCAIVTGANTVLVDDPSLNLRYDELGSLQDELSPQQLRQPLRVVIDSQNRVTPTHKIVAIESPILIIRRAKDDCDWPEHVEQLVLEGEGKIDLQQVMEHLGAREINSVWVEAGATLAGALIEANLCDELIIYQAPKLMGTNNKGLLNLPSIDHMNKLRELSISDIRMLGRDIRIRATFED